MMKITRFAIFLSALFLLSSCSQTIFLKVGNRALVKGQITYPGEICPPDIKAYAFNKQTGKTYVCEHFSLEVGLNPEFKFILPPGEYEFYAKSESGYSNEYRAYYTEFVRCGMKLSCPSHEKIIVTVGKGQTVSDIVLGDWYMNLSPNKID